MTATVQGLIDHFARAEPEVIFQAIAMHAEEAQKHARYEKQLNSIQLLASVLQARVSGFANGYEPERKEAEA